jgi:hypothetical protein
MKKRHFPLAWPKRLQLNAASALALAAFCIGCGGGGSGSVSTGSAPTSTTKTNTAAHIASFGLIKVGANLSPFGKGLPIPARPTVTGPVYEPALQLWMSASASGSTLTESIFLDKAETQPAGSATFTLDAATKTLTGTFNITGGPESGLNGTFSQTVTKNGTTGTYSFTLPNGTSVSCSFTVTLSAVGVPTGTGSETITEADGYSETAVVVYHSDGSTTIKAADSNGYKSTVNITADGSGSGTLSGPDPGLPAVVVWNSAGTGTVTFANFITLSFTNWQLPNP